LAGDKVIVPLAIVAVLLWTESSYAASCRDSRVPPRSSWPLRLEVDVDGDGVGDVLEAERSVGSGFSSTDVRLSLGGSGVRLEAEENFAFTAIVSINPVPKELLEPRHRGPLAWIEEALFSRVCASPDPSLAWLLDPKKRLTWTKGPPQIPAHYAIRLPAKDLAGSPAVLSTPPVSGGKPDPDGEFWLFYAGGVHTMNAYQVVELARKGDRVLLGTAHGVILTNRDRSRHAWIYVYPGDGEVKLRLPSIAGARLEGDTAIITLNRRGEPDDSPTSGKIPKPIQVRVNLKTGAILE
jgi:hypothetical protein